MRIRAKVKKFQRSSNFTINQLCNREKKKNKVSRVTSFVTSIAKCSSWRLVIKYVV